MLAWINELTDVTDWQSKIFDPDFVFRWKSAKILSGQDVTQSMADWVRLKSPSLGGALIWFCVQCVDEVKNYVEDFSYTRIIPAIDGGIVKSDDCIDISVKSDLKRVTSALRRDPTIAPRLQEPIVDLVDPYLFPFAFGRTKTLRGSAYLSPDDCISRTGDGEVVKMPPEGDTKQEERGKYPNDMAWSRRFQWLPFDIVWRDRGHGGAR